MAGLSPKNPRDYTGPNLFLNVVVTRKRRPTGADVVQPENGQYYKVFTGWQVGKNPTTGDEGELWMLSKIVANVAYWVPISAGVPATGPLLGIDVDATSGTGTDPVVPNLISGLIAITGGVRDNAGLPVRTISTTAESLTVQVQRTTASVGADATKAGLASFNSTQFTVDASTGFVSLAGGGIPIDQINVQAATGPGVDPVDPTALGLLTIDGTIVAAQSIPIRTHTTALNQFAVEVQYASDVSPTNAANAGLASFNDAQFVADANGWVSLVGGAGPAANAFDTDSVGDVTPVLGVVKVYGQSGTVGATSGIQVLTDAADTMLVRMLTPYTLGDFAFNSTTGGATRTVTVQNTIDAASSQASIATAVAGTTSGDVWHQFNVGSTTGFSLGIDNDDSDKLKITYAASATINPSTGSEYFSMLPTTGAVIFQADNPASALGVVSQPLTGSLASGYRAFFANNDSANAAAQVGISLSNDVASSECGLQIQSAAGSGLNPAPSFASKLGVYSNDQLEGIVYSVQKTTATHTWYTNIAGTATLFGTLTAAGNWELGLNASGLSGATTPLLVQKNQDASTTIAVGNTSSGTSALAGLLFSNDATFATITIPSSAYTTAAIRNTIFINGAQASMNGIVYAVNTTGSHTFYNNVSGGGVLATLNAESWTVPIQPSFRAYLSADALNVTGNNTAYTVAFNTEVANSDRNADYNTGTYTFTAPVAGLYHFVVNLYSYTHTAAGTTYNLILANSAGTQLQILQRMNPTGIFEGGASGNICTTSSALLQLAAADTVKVVFTVNGEGADTIDIASGASSSTFSAWLMG